MSVSFDAVLGGLGNKAVETLKATMSDAWGSLTDDEKAQCEHLLFSLAKAHLLELAGQDVSDVLPVLEAALAQWKVVGKQVAISALKSAATEVLGYAGAFAGSAVAAALKSAL